MCTVGIFLTLYILGKAATYPDLSVIIMYVILNVINLVCISLILHVYRVSGFFP